MSGCTSPFEETSVLRQVIERGLLTLALQCLLDLVGLIGDGLLNGGGVAEGAPMLDLLIPCASAFLAIWFAEVVQLHIVCAPLAEGDEVGLRFI